MPADPLRPARDEVMERLEEDLRGREDLPIAYDAQHTADIRTILARLAQAERERAELDRAWTEAEGQIAALKQRAEEAERLAEERLERAFSAGWTARNARQNFDTAWVSFRAAALADAQGGPGHTPE